MKIELYGLKLPRIDGKVDLSKLIVDFMRRNRIPLDDGDILVLASKFVQKALNLTIDISKVKPSFKARLISKVLGKDPIETQIILDNSQRILLAIPSKFLVNYVNMISRDPEAAKQVIRKISYLFLTLSKNGFITTDSGLDYSNLPIGKAIVNAFNFDAIAKKLRLEIKRLSGVDISVVISDTEVTISNGKVGSLDFAVGSSGIDPITREFGARDLYDRPKFGGIDIVVDEVCAAAALLMKQAAEGIPAVLIKGLKYERSELGVNTILISRFGYETHILLLKMLILNLLCKLLRIF